MTFLGFQAVEYVEAYRELGLTLGSGIYGSTFFMLTGFHGAHVTLGTVMLAVMLVRILRGHFDAEHQFGFEAASWYWHFVDVVWIILFFVIFLIVSVFVDGELDQHTKDRNSRCHTDAIWKLRQPCDLCNG